MDALLLASFLSRIMMCGLSIDAHHPCAPKLSSSVCTLLFGQYGRFQAPTLPKPKSSTRHANGSVIVSPLVRRAFTPFIPVTVLLLNTLLSDNCEKRGMQFASSRASGWILALEMEQREDSTSLLMAQDANLSVIHTLDFLNAIAEDKMLLYVFCLQDLEYEMILLHFDIPFTPRRRTSQAEGEKLINSFHSSYRRRNAQLTDSIQ